MRKLFLLAAVLVLPGCVLKGGKVVVTPPTPEQLCAGCGLIPDPIAKSACVQSFCPAPTPSPVSSTPTVASTSLPSPSATVGPLPTASPTAAVIYNPPPPPIDMSTSGAPVTDGWVEITQHYQPQVWASLPASGYVRAEIPQDPVFWGNPGAAKNCDGCTQSLAPLCGGHNSDQFGNRTIMWWVCGGSITYKTLPQSWDIDQPFMVTCSPSLTCSYPGGRDGRTDNFNARVQGHGGSVTVCVPQGATSHGVVMPVQNRCGSWPVQ